MTEWGKQAAWKSRGWLRFSLNKSSTMMKGGYVCIRIEPQTQQATATAAEDFVLTSGR